jgi:hypothetical protein
MRWLVVFACGCNAILGLHDDYTRRPSLDAKVYDAPFDAPFTCPPLGVAPKFRRTLHGLPITDCSSYSISHATNRALAWCHDPVAGGFYTAEGPLDGPLARIDLPPPANHDVWEPRLSADGDQLVRLTYDAAQVWGLEVWHRDATAWSLVGPVAYSVPQSLVARPTVSTISRGPDRRFLVAEANVSTGPAIKEFADTGGGFQLVDTYDYSAIGPFVGSVGLSADGLRIVYSDQLATWYSDRPSLDAHFGKEVMIDTPQPIYWPVLDDDCGKLYISGLDSVFFLEQAP